MNLPFIDTEANAFAISRDQACRVAFRSETPCISLLTNFLSPEECSQLISMSEERIEHSMVVSNKGDGASTSANRNSYDVSYSRNECEFIGTIDARIASVCNWDIERSTGLQVIRYRPGEYFSPHFDFLPPSVLEKSGEPQRVATILIYLNDVTAGGCTSFPDAGLSFAPQIGATLFFLITQPVALL